MTCPSQVAIGQGHDLSGYVKKIIHIVKTSFWKSSQSLDNQNMLKQTEKKKILKNGFTKIGKVKYVSVASPSKLNQKWLQLIIAI